MTTRISTVRGEVSPASLGATLMHEHIIAVSAALARDRPELAYPGGRGAVIDTLVAQLQQVKDAGIDTIVDLSVFGHDRDVAALVEINRRVDLNIVVATGFYTDTLPSKTFEFRQRLAERDGQPHAFARIFIADIVDGISSTGVRAGMLKCVTDSAGITPQIAELMRGCAIAARETGVPISTHSHPATRNGLDQLAFFEREGVDLERVVIGHSGDTDDLDYLRRIMDSGATIGCDRFELTLPGSPPPERCIEVVAELCQQGYSDRIVLSHDKMMHTDWFGESSPFGQRTVPLYVSEVVLPGLRTHGVREADITQLMHGTPARILGRAA